MRNLLALAPSGTDADIAALEDTPYVFSAADFGFADPLDTPPDDFFAVQVAMLPDSGSLVYSGGAVVEPGVLIAVADIEAGALSFVPALNAHGSPYTSLSFQVQDDGGGVDLDPTPNTLTLHVKPLNDAPYGAGGLLTVRQNERYTFGLTDFGYRDADDSPPNNFRAVRIVQTTWLGSLRLNDVPIVPHEADTIAIGDIAAGKLTYAAPAAGFGATYFLFAVQDDGGSTAGADPAHMGLFAIYVPDPNPPPSGRDSEVSTSEDTAYTFTVSDFYAPSGVVQHNLLAVYLTTLPPLGVLALGGIPVEGQQFIEVSDIASGRLQYLPPPAGNGIAYENFQFQVQDDGGTADGRRDLDPTPNTAAINITQAVAALRLDVNRDGFVSASDAVAIINYLNALGRSVPSAAAGEAGPTLAYDATGDGHVAAGDVLSIINYINAYGSTGEGESAVAATSSGEPQGDAASDPFADTLALLASDVAGQPRKRR